LLCQSHNASPIREDKVQATTPTPSCTQFATAEVDCPECGKSMRVTLIEPHKNNTALELRTYRCTSCEHVESYLLHL
jgi:transposase-like protein